MKTIIVDVDSTIANVANRTNFALDHAKDLDQNADLWHDPRLFVMDDLILQAWVHLTHLRNYYRIVFVSGRRNEKDAIYYFSNWLRKVAMHPDQTWQTFFVKGFDVKFRPKGAEVKAWKSSVISQIAETETIVAGYGNSQDMPIYNLFEFQTFEVDEKGNGWDFPIEMYNNGQAFE